MKPHQHQFIEFCIKRQVLRFGEFKLKSGRISPYFFNAGLFNDGHSLTKLGQFYAETITATDINYDLIFGPAYKGIPLVATTAIALSEKHNLNVRYAFNRKEVKDHGEGGDIVGSPLAGSVLIIDDVITAGTAIREAINIINDHHAKAAGIVIALDREERGQGKESAIQEIENTHNIPVISIIKLNHLVEFLQADRQHHANLSALQNYRDKYGTTI